MVKKIAVIGPESTGKSTLCLQLARHYGTLWCPEYAREYLTIHGVKYGFDDLSKIAVGQLALEDSYAKKVAHWAGSGIVRNPLLFIDTEMMVMKTWGEYVFGDCETFVLDEIAKRRYDLYLLASPDLPWQQDSMREYPDDGPRMELFHHYKDMLVHQEVPWHIVGGQDKERLELVVGYLEVWLEGGGSVS